MKSFIGATLKKAWESLRLEHQGQLTRQGNYSELQDRITAKVNALKELRDELKATDASTLAEWDTRFRNIIEEFEAACQRADSFLEAVKEMKNQVAEESRTAKAAEAYQLKILAEALEDGPPATSFGSFFSKAAASLLRNSHEQSFIVDDPKDLNFSEPMVFQQQSDLGSKVHGVIEKYQGESEITVAEKVQALTEYLANNEKKMGAMTLVPNGSKVPLLKQELHLPDDPLLPHDEGTSPWVTVSRSFAYRWGPSMFPWPSVGSYVEPQTEAGASFLLNPGETLINAAVVVLAQVGKFLNSESGSELVQKHGTVITWQPRSPFIAWIPFGCLAFHINTLRRLLYLSCGCRRFFQRPWLKESSTRCGSLCSISARSTAAC